MEFLDLSILNKLPLEEQFKIKKGIIETNELSSIPVAYLPDIIATKYYFISYSHLDYKKVYSDLFDLQLNNLPFWYDRGIPAGKDWIDIASKYISPFECTGVIFYISENALTSESIVEEIKYVDQVKKDYLVILISENESMADLINRLYNEKKINKETKEFFEKVFPPKNIYLKYSESGQTKAEKILRQINGQELLELDLNDKTSDYFVRRELSNGDYWSLIVRGLNSYTAREVKLSDYYDALKTTRLKELLVKEYEKPYDYDPNSILNNISDLIVDNGSFSNMKSIETIELPNPKLSISFGNYAFYRCASLKEIGFVDKRKRAKQFEYFIGEGAFFGCKNLKHFNFTGAEISSSSFQRCDGLEEVDLSLSNNDRIPSFAFAYCSSLKNVILPNECSEIERCAFRDCALEKIVFPKSMRKVDVLAFYNCKQLKQVILNEDFDEIAQYAFSGTGINSIKIPRFISAVYLNAFELCDNLTKIIFGGTYEEFLEVVEFNDRPTKEIELVCKNGSYAIKI